MAEKIIKLKIVLNGADKISGDIEGIDDGLSQLDRINFNNLKNQLSGLSVTLGTFAGNIASDAIRELTSLAKQGASEVLAYTASLEQAHIGFETLIGSVQGADAHIRELQSFAAKTPFEFAGLVKSSQLLQGVGIESRRIIPILSDVGNALSAVGKGQEEINRTVLALSQIASKGKVAGQEINQLAENGISAVTVLSQALGKSRAEIIKLSEEGKISSDLFLEALHKFVEANGIGDAMERQSHTFNGALSNIKDNLLITASTAFQPYFDKISTIADETAKSLSKLTDGGLDKIGETMAKSIAKTFGVTLRYLLDESIQTIKDDLNNKSTIYTPQQFGADLADAFLGDTPNYNEYFVQGITTDMKRAKREIENLKQAAESLKDVKVPQGFLALSKEGNIVKGIDTLTNTFKEINLAVNETPNLADKLDAATAEQQVKSLKIALDSSLSLLDNSFKIGSANINSRQIFTDADKINQTVSESALRQGFLNKQIELQKSFFNQEISLYKNDADKVADIVQERNKVLGNLNTELRLNEINSQKQISDAERRIFEQRRQAQIQFKQLQIQESQFNFDNKLFDISREIQQQTVSANEGYAQLRQITQDSYAEILRITKESFALQLQNQSLTIEQRNNLVKQGYLEELKLAENNRRAILKIDENLLSARLSLIEQFSSRLREKQNNDLQFFSTLVESFKNAVPNVGTSQFGTYQKNLRADIQLTADALKDANKKVEEFNSALSEKGANTGILNEGLRNINLYRDGLYNALLQKQETYKVLTEISNDIISGVSIDTVNQKLIDAQEVFEKGILDTQKKSLIKQLSEVTENTEKRAELEHQLTLVYQQEINSQAKFQKERDAEFYNSITNLKNYLDLLKSGDKVAVKFVQDNAQKDLLKEQIGDYQQIITLKERLANSPYIDSLAIEKAQLQDLIALRNQDTQAIIATNRAQLELSQKGNFSALQANAQFLDFLNQNTKSLTDIYASANIGIVTTFWDSLDRGISKATDKLGLFGNVIKQVLLDLVKLATSKIFSQSFGGASVAQNGGGGFDIGGIIKNIFGGGSGTGLNNSNVIRNFAGGSSGASGFGGAPLSSVFTSPGASLSSTLGGEKGGGILGLLQGLIGGGGGAGGGASALAGGSAGLAALLNPVTAALVLAPIGLTTRNPLIGALTLGLTGFIASIFNRNSQRKKDERARTEYINEALASFGDFDKLIADVRALRIDGGSAISQATQLSANIRSNYLAQASQLKDNKTRNIAIKDVSRIDDQINAKMKDLRAAADEARVAGDIDKRLNASFATGVYMDKAFRNQYGDFKRRNGMLAGAFTGNDTLKSILAEGEMVLNPGQINAVIDNAGGVDVFKGAGIPNYAGGTYVEPTTPKFTAPSFSGSGLSSSRSESNQKIVVSPEITIRLSGIIGLEEEMEAVMEGGDIQRKIIKIVNDGKSRNIR